MDLRERDRLRWPTEASTPQVPAVESERPAARVRAILRPFLGVPFLAIGAMIAMAIVNGQPQPAPGPRIDLRSAKGGDVTALVFGAGSGIHFRRVSENPVAVPVDLSRGPLRIVALRAVRLEATDVGDPAVVRLMASGPVIQLRRDGERVSVRAGF